MFTPFHSHSCLSIFPIATRFSQKNTFLLYFGANTIWYLQFHFVCDKLCMSFIPMFDLPVILPVQLADRTLSLTGCLFFFTA